MRWRVRKIGARYRALHRWHRWYAWYPVRVPTAGRMSGMTRVWLSTVWRKGELVECWDDSWWSWEYKWEKLKEADE